MRRRSSRDSRRRARLRVCRHAPGALRGPNPPFFWALDAAGPDTVERQGIYVHPELVSDVRVHPGDFVVEYVEADVTVNVRLLGSGPRRAA